MLLNSNIYAYFDNELNPATVNDSTFLVQGSESGEISGTIKYYPNVKMAEFIPSSDLISGEVITVHLTQEIQDNYNNGLLPDYQWSFSIGSALDETPPSPISGLTASDDADGGIDLTWTPNEDTDFAYYRIYRETTSFNDVTGLVPIGISLQSNYRDTQINIGTEYYYAVTAVDRNGNEDKSVLDFGPVTTSNTIPPQPPDGLLITVENETTLHLSWAPNPEHDITGYKIYYGFESGIHNYSIDVGNNTNYLFENLLTGITYFTIITAYDNQGNESAASAEISGTLVSNFRATDDSYESDQPDVEIDSHKNIHIVWVDSRDGNYEIYYKMMDKDRNVLIDDTRLTLNNADSRRSSIIIDSQDKVYIVWHDRRGIDVEIYFMKLDPSLDNQDGDSADPATIKLIGDTPLTIDDGVKSSVPRFVIDSDDNIHVVWSEEYEGNKVLYKKIDSNGSTLIDEIIVYSGGYFWRAYPVIGVDSDRNVHIVWNNEFPTSDFELSYKMLNGFTGATLIEKTLISDDDGANSKWQSLVIDNQDQVIIIWQDMKWGEPEIFFMKLDPHLDDQNGDAADINTIKIIGDTALTPADGRKSNHPSAIMDTFGNCHITWFENWATWNCGNLHYMVVDNQGNFIRPDITITVNPTAATATAWTLGRIAVDKNDGSAHIVWCDNRDGNYEIYYSCFVSKYPKIIKEIPDDGASDVPLNSHIFVTFSTDMDMSTINETTFIVDGSMSGAITGTLSYESQFFRTEFTPLSLYAVGETITVTLSREIKNIAGNGLISDHIWSFNTGDASDTTAPSMITGLIVQDVPDDNGGNIELTWDPSTAEDLIEYHIYRDISPINDISSMTPIGLSVNNSYLDAAVEDGIDYYYAVTAYDQAGNENPEVVSFGPVQSLDNLPPDIPKGFTAALISEDSISLNWEPNTEIDLANYNAYWDTIPRMIQGESVHTTGDLDDTYSNEGLLYEGIYVRVYTEDDSNLFALIEVYNPSTSSWETLYNGSGGNRIVIDEGYSTPIYSQIRIRLDDTDDDDIIYYQYSFSLGSYQNSQTLGSETTTYQIDNLQTCTTFYLSVTALDETGNESDYAQQIAVTTGLHGTPSSPAGLTGSPGEQSVILNWTQNTECDLSGYNIYRSTNCDGTYTLLDALITGTSYTDENLFGINYCYYLTAADILGNESESSEIIMVMPVDTNPPAVPTGVNATSVSENSVSLTWQANSEPDLANYKIYWDSETTLKTTQGESLHTTGDLNDTYSDEDGFLYQYIYVWAYSSDNDTLFVRVEGYNPFTTSWETLYSGSGRTRVVIDRNFLTPIYSQIRILVNDSENNDTIYYRYTFSTGQPLYRNSLVIGPDITAYQIDNLQTCADIFFAVTSLDSSGNESGFSQARLITTTLPGSPTAPTGLVGTSGELSAILNWQVNPECDIAGYNIYRSNNCDGTYTLIDSLVSGPSYTDTGLLGTVNYCYYITAVDTVNNEGVASSVVSVLPNDTTPPAIPSGLVLSPGDGLIDLQWLPNTESDLAGYRIFYGTSPGNYTQTADVVNGTTYQLTGLTNGTKYYIVIASYDLLGNQSNYSAEMSAIPQPLMAILFVDDYGNSTYQSESYFKDALQANNKEFNLWTVVEQGGTPSFNYLSQYEMVIWSTADDETSTLSGQDEANLKSYLDNGGRLFLSSQFLTYDIGLTDFVTNYLHITNYQYIASYNRAIGIASDPISDGVDTDLSFPGRTYAYTITPDAEVSTIFNNETGSPVAIRYANPEVSSSRVVYFTFPFESLSITENAPNNQNTILGRVVDWLSIPTVVSTFPENASPDMPPDTDILVYFSEDMDVSTLDASSITVSGSVSGAHTMTLLYEPSIKRLRLDPDSDFVSGEQIDVTLSSGISDLHGETLENDYSWSFTIGTASDTTPPAQVTGLTAQVITENGSILLSWNSNQEPDLDLYRIYRDTTPVSDVTGLEPIAISYLNNYHDLTTTAGEDYYYAVTAVDIYGNEDKSALGVGPITSIDDPPSAPTGLIAQPGDQITVVNVSWSENPETDIAGYNLYYGFSSGIYEYIIDVGNQTSYQITETICPPYYIKLTAYDQRGFESTHSQEIEVHYSRTEIIEDFESGSLSLWTQVSGSSGNVNTASAHDGIFGVTDPGWHYRMDSAATVQQGDTISAWFRPSSTGRFYLGFGADSTGCYSFVAAINTNDIHFQDNHSYGYIELNSSPQAWQLGKWYRLEVQWEVEGITTGYLYDSDGTTLLNSVTQSLTGRTSGGIAIRSFSSISIDTIERKAFANAEELKIANTIPSKDALDVPLNTHITILFHEDMDPTTLNTTTVNVEGNISGIQSGNIIYLDSLRRLIFEPDSDFTPGETLTVTLDENVSSITGEFLGCDYRWSFTVGDAMDDTPPSPVTGLSASDVANDAGGKIDISWDSSSAQDLAYYKVYRDTAPITSVSGLTPIAYTTSNFYTDENTIDETDYYYAVTAIDTCGNEDFTVSGFGPVASRDNIPPVVPSGLSVFLADDMVLELHWAGNTEPDLAGYKLYYGTTDQYGSVIDVGTQTSYQLSGLDTDTTYYLTITAYDTSGNESSYTTGVNALSETIKDILLVIDEENSTYLSEPYFRTALNANNFSYNTWNINNQNISPPSDYLSGFSVVIWSTGDDNSATLSDAEEQNLQAYLDQGGFLFLSSQFLPYTNGMSNFVQNYLHIISYEESQSYNTLTGTNLDPISDSLQLLLNFPGRAYSNPVNIDPSASVIFVNENEGYPSMGLRYAGDYRLVYFAFPFEAISDTDPAPNNQNTVMARVINWLAAPSVNSTIPPDNSGNMPGNINILVTFSEDMDYETITQSTFLVSGSTSGSIEGVIIYYPEIRTAVFNPSLEFSQGETVTVTLTTGIQDLSGTGLQSEYIFSFIIEALPDETPPGPIQNLTAIDTPNDSGGSISLAWDSSPDTDLAYYKVYRDVLAFSDISGLTPLTITNAISFDDTTTVDGTNYYYAVTAVDSSGNEDPSVTSAGPVLSLDNIPPAIPSGLSGTVIDETSVSLTWGANSEEDLSGYIVYWGTVSRRTYGESAHTLGDLDNTYSSGGFLYKEIYVWAYSGDNDTLFVQIDAYNPSSDTWDSLYSGSGGTRVVIDHSYSIPLYSQIRVRVNDTENNDTIYYQYAFLIETIPYENSQTLGPDITTYQINDLVPCSTYYASITALDHTGNESGFSQEISLDTVSPGPPAAPSGLVASPRKNSIILSWQANSECDLTGYRIYRSLISGSNYSLIGSGLTDTTYTDTGLTTGTTYYYVITAEDSQGNESLYSQEISAVPVNQPPQAVIGGPYSGNEGSIIHLDGSGSNDPDPGDIVSFAWDLDNDGLFDDAYTVNPGFIQAENGSYTISLRVSDGQETDTESTTVTIQNVPPTVDVGPDITIDEGQSINFTASIFDPGTLDTHTFMWDFGDSTTSDLQNPTHLYSSSGTYTVVLICQDDDGGEGQDSLLVTVRDLDSPVPDIDPLPDLIGHCPGIPMPAPTATDNTAGTVYGVADPMIYTVPGTYTVTWTYSDEYGNTANQSQTVVIEDTDPPVPDLTELPIVRGECSTDVIDVPTATDICSGQIAGTTNDPLSYSEFGTYEIAWTFDDGYGNVATQTQTIVVEDTEGPVPDLAELPTVTGECSVEVTEVPTATDLCSGPVQGTTNDPLTYNSLGTHTITWSYDDNHGNISSQTQLAIASDTISPEITCSADVSVTCDPGEYFAYDVVLGMAGATDNCDPDVGILNDAPPYFPKGNNNVTWTATDDSGNQSTCVQIVTVDRPAMQFDVGPSGSGHPFTTIQSAIDGAADGDTIVTHEGTYYENINFKGKLITLISVNPDNPAIVASTVIDGSQTGSVVTFNSGEGRDAQLTGFTIRNGNAAHGGGIDCHASSPTISKSIITWNTAAGEGYGGGIACRAPSSPMISYCSISFNSARDGGGISCLNSSPEITHCMISDNSASRYDGGGISCRDYSSPHISTCTIVRNSADYYGGGISCIDSSPTLENCIIAANQGIYYHAGGIYASSSSPSMVNCTVTGNTTGGSGGGMACLNSSIATVINCILWNNSPDGIHNDDTSSSLVTYSDVQGGFTGQGNINADPLFFAPDQGNYYLQLDSPCIDAGTGENAPSVDFDGNPRPLGEAHDMGAFENAEDRITITEGDYTTTTQINLFLYSQGAIEMIISDDPGFQDAYWEPYTYYKTFTLSADDGEKTVYAKFRDDLGQETEVVSDTIILDTTPPSITSTSPEAEAVVNKIIPITSTILDDSTEIARVEFYIDGDKKAEFSEIQEVYTWDWDTRGYADGGHVIMVTAYDILDNNQSEQIAVFVSYEPPSTPMITSPADQTLTDQSTIVVSGTADPQCDIEVLVNSTLAGTCSSDSIGNFNCNGIPLVENTNLITAIASDSYQTSPESAPVLVVLDTISLTPQITIDQGDYTDTPDISLTITCDNATQMMLSENPDFASASWQGFQTAASWTLSQDDGQKTIHAKFKKDYGYESQTVTDIIILSTTAPQVTITQPQDGATIVGAGQATASVASLVSMQYVEFFLDNTLQFTDTTFPYIWAFSSHDFSDGLHTLKVEALDALGRSGTSQIYIITGDIVAPPAIQGLNAQRGDTYADLTWLASPAGDLDHYNIYMSTNYFTTVAGMTPLATTTGTSYRAEDLTNGLTYWFAVTAIDGFGNEEKVVTPDGATPQDLAPDPVTGFNIVNNYPEVTLSWNVSTAHDFAAYNIYQSLFPIEDVLGLTPLAQINEQSTQTYAVMDLDVKQTYYFAIVVEDLAGHKSDVSSGSIYLPDLPPVVSITQPQNGDTITRLTTIQANATDPDGMAQVEFFIDNTLVATDTTSPYTYEWNIFGLTPSSYQIKAKATDTKGYTAEHTINVYVEPGPPPAPVITSPTHNTTVGDAQIQVVGMAQTGTQVYILLNSIQSAGPLDVDASGQFSAQLIITEGQNWIEATAQDQGGVSPKSQSILVTLDLEDPEAPRLVQTTSLSSGKIRITWQAPLGEIPAGYHIYRSDQPFYNTSDAQRLNSSIITKYSFDDVPSSDGTYYYALTTIDVAGNESTLSEPVEGLSDSLPPEITELILTPHGPKDEASGRCGQGQVDILITVSEELMTTPFMSITPQAGFPISINLARLSSTQYSGSFEITESTPSGTAFVIFSGRDLVGNRGTQINVHHTLEIDTSGPAIIDLQISPQPPVENDAVNPVTLDVSFTIDQPVKEGTTPQFWYRYAQNTTGIEITPVSQDTIDPLTYHVQFTLAPEVGSTGQDLIEFFFQAMDDLDNLGDRITVEKRFEVYQGDLPALGIPLNVSARALPEGKIEISWNAVTDASGYQLYRKAPGEIELTLYGDVIQALSYIDETIMDGFYQYAVSSVRILGEEVSLSPLSSAVSATADSIPPDPPQNLVLELTGSGIMATWEAPAGEEPASYTIYRSADLEILSTEGLIHLQSNIVSPAYLDPSPSLTEQCYAVCAVDAAGNESAPSESQYYNFSLLPVPTLTVTTIEGELPVLSWTTPGGNIVSFNAYVKVHGENILMHQEPLVETTITDQGYNLTDREYIVTAVDINGFESVGHTAHLQVISAQLAQDAMLYRGIVNRLHFLVINNSPEVANISRLEVTYEDKTYASSAFTVDPGATKEVSVVVGGDMDLPDILPMTISLIQNPEPNTTIKTISYSDIPVGEATLSLSINNDVFTRGGTGQVSFTLYNTTTETIEIRTAQPGGGTSPDIRFKIIDPDGNVLSCVALMQNTGTEVVTVSNGYSVARIPSAKGFTCQITDIFLPLSAPDEVIIQAEIDRVYYHYNLQDQVEVPGINVVAPVSLVDTSYYARVLAVDPMVSVGDDPVTISGRAFNRQNNEPLGLVPVKIGISVRGFTRHTEVYTDDAGNFSYDFIPVYGEAGFYTVWAVHPEVVAQPMQAFFSILRISVNPENINLRVPKNYTQTMTVAVKNLSESSLYNLQLVYDSAYQPGGVFPEGIIVNTGSPLAELQANTSTNLSFSVTAQDNAPQEGQFFLIARSDEVQGDTWGLIQINYTFTEAEPVLQFSPIYLEGGVRRGETGTTTLRIKNAGLSILTGISLSLVPLEGQNAQDWIKLGVSSDQGDLPVGVHRDISVVFQPGEDVPDDVYRYILRIESNNYQTTDVNIYVTVTSSEYGNALIHVGDIYEGKDDGQGGVIYGLAGATVKLQHSKLLHLIYTGTTDNNGDYLFTDLPTGKYTYRVSATKHEPISGTLFVQPGLTVTEKAFLQIKLVTVEWEVVPIVIEDRYEIKITTTFETDVPAPVVTVEPTAINIPNMEIGEVYNGEFIVTNHGLIRAEDFKCNFPQSDQYYNYQLLAEIPETLEAKQQIIVPFRLTCLSILGEETGDSTGGTGGGGSYSYNKSGDFSYNYAVNIVWVDCSGSGKAPFVFHRASGGGGGGYVSGGGGDGGGYVYAGPVGSVSGGTSIPQPLTIYMCIPDPPKPPEKEKPGDPEQNNENGDGEEPGDEFCTLSSVNLVKGDYSFTETDLSLMINGYNIGIYRDYYDSSWHYPHMTKDQIAENYKTGSAKFKTLIAGGREYIDKLVKGNIEYTLAGELVSDYINADDLTGLIGQNYLYKNDTYTIRTKGGYFDTVNKFHFDKLLWKTSTGDWKEYDQWGRKIAYGDRNNNRIELILEDGENGKVLGVKDGTGRQVLWYEYNPDNSIKAVQDHTGRRVEYFYDASGQLIRVKDVLGNDWTYAYDGEGRIITKTDPLQRSTHISYNTAGRVESVLDDNSDGTYYEYNYDSLLQEYYAAVLTSGGIYTERYFNKDGEIIRELINGNLNREIIYNGRTRIIKDRAGNETIKKFDEWNNLVYIQNPDGTSRSFKYDPKYSNLIEERNEKGVITRYEYDAQGNQTKMIEAAGTALERIIQYSYDDQGNMLSTVLPDGSVIGVEYDQYGRMVKYTDPENNVTEYNYDEFGNRISKKDAHNHVWSYGYDDRGRLISETDPLNHTTRYEYDTVGNRTALIDAKENRTEFTYDLGDRTKEIKDALEGIVVYDYDSDGHLIKVTDQVNNIAQYEYDSEGRRSKMIDAMGNETIYSYDETTTSGCSSCASGAALGKPSHIIYPTYTKNIEYDPMGRVTREIEVLDEDTLHETQYLYDAIGNVIKKTDPEENATSYEYDSFNRLTRVIDAANGATQYGYDLRDNLTSLTDAEENTTIFTYDKNGRKEKEIRPMGQEFNYTYDEVGNISTSIDAKGQMTAYEYDEARRQTFIRYYSASDHTTPEKTVSFAYDEIGNLISYSDGTTSATYNYDDISRKTVETVNYGAFNLSYSYDYYADGAKKSFTGPDGITYNYSYDSGQLSTITIPGVGNITYDNYQWQAPTTINLPGGTVRQLEFDPLMRVKKINVQNSSGTILMDYNYTRDRMGNILSKTAEHGDYSYTYDDIYQLVSADNPEVPEINDEAYTYDKVGNRLTDNSYAGVWDYNNNNQLTGYDGISFVYDENGNTIQKNDNGVITNYFYNLEDRLARVEDGSGAVIAIYYYDPMGRRLKKDVSGTVTYFFYSDEGLIGEYDNASSEIKVYGYRPDSPWMTNPLYLKEGSNYYYYQNDHLGTPQIIVNGSGNLVWSGKYSSFGKVEIEAASTITNNLRFPGQYEDAETGLHYNLFRYYNLITGRYLNIDPISLKGGINLYNYVLNNPINLSDLLGLKFIMNKNTKVKTDISIENSKNKAIKQMQMNSKINKYLNDILKTNCSKCKDKSLNDFIDDSGSIDVDVYITDAPWYEGSGITHWPGVFWNSGWRGKVPSNSIGLDADDLFQSDFFDTDNTDEQDAAEILIHEFVHWLTAYCLGKATGPGWRGSNKESSYDEGQKVQDMIDWDLSE